jgi:hypothetical protein
MVGVGDGELRARSQAGAEREEKEDDGEDEGFEGRPTENRHVKLCWSGKRAPISGKRE